MPSIKFHMRENMWTLIFSTTSSWKGEMRGKFKTQKIKVD